MTSKKILIIGYNLFDYLNSIVRAFEQNGLVTIKHEHDNLRAMKGRHPNPLKAFRASLKLNRLNKKVIQKVHMEKPDYILVINSEPLFPETVHILKKQCPCAVWLVDGYNYLEFLPEAINAYDHQLVFEPTDTRYLPKAHYLNYGADPHHYHPDGLDKLYDLTFVGNGHENRLPILDRIALISEQYPWNFAVFGKFQWFLSSRRGRLYRRKYPHLAECIKINRIMNPLEINRIYNQSRLNLNIHHEQSVQGVNPRTFEIPASGSCMLVDRQPLLPDYLIEGQECLAYDNLDELINVVNQYIHNKTALDNIAHSGYQKVIQNHTFKNRCGVILDILNHS